MHAGTVASTARSCCGALQTAPPRPMTEPIRASRRGAPARTLDSLLAAAVERHGDRPALVSGEHELTYGALDAAVQRLTARLAGLDSPLAGSRVAVIGPNLPALVTGMFAVWRAGAVAVPLSARLREYELTAILADAAPAAVVTVPSYRGFSFVDLLRSQPQHPVVLVVDDLGEVEHDIPAVGASSDLEPLDPVIGALLYTSGTTGQSKGTLVQHAREADAAQALNEILELSPEDTCAQVIPIAHAFGLSCMLTALSAGARLVLADSSVSVRPLLTAVERQGATILHGSPALFISVLKAAPEALPGFEWRIEPSSAAAAEGGELWVRGPWVTPGYYRRPAETAEAFVDGWFRTGDIGSFDDGGHLRITGRLKEVVLVAGFSVFPAEIEGFLLTHPDVAQAAVIGAPHEQVGEVLQAFVVPRSGADLTPTSLLQFARSKVADYKLPYGIRVVPELPLLASGKPDRIALGKLAAAQPETGAQA